MKIKIKNIGILLLVAIMLISGGSVMPLNADALNVNLLESNVMVREGKSYQLLNSTRKFKIYVKTLYPEGYPTQGGTLNTNDLGSTLGSGGVGGTWNVTVSSVADGYSLENVLWNWGKATWDGNTFTIKSDGKKDGDATFVFKFTGFNVTYNLGNLGSFNENGLNTITKKYTYGQAEAPAFTLNPGCVFEGWDNSLEINSSRTLNAQGKFEVGFNSNGGSNVDPVQVSPGGTLSEPITPTRAGHTFSGWYTDSTFNNRYTFGTTVDSSLTLFAKWSVKWYLINFNGQGAEASTVPTERNIAFGSKLGELALPIRKGFTFRGWNTQADGLGDMLTADSVMTERNITLYAQWTTDVYTIEFDLNGHMGQTPAPQSRYYGEKLDEVISPVREHYRFLGWNTKADGSGDNWNFEIGTAFSSLTLYAKWEEIRYYDLHFNSKGGTAVPSVINIEEGGKTIAPAEPKRSGYSFGGWYKNEQLTSKWNFNEDSVTETITLYAKWNANAYTVSFERNGAWTTQPSTQRVSFGSKVLAPITPKKIGYVFAGWKTSGGVKWEFDNSMNNAGDFTLTADWIAATYSVSFVENGSGVSGMPSVINATYKSAVTLPAAPSRSGYIFTGWNTQANGAGQRAENLFAGGMVVNNVRLYAQWKQISR